MLSKDRDESNYNHYQTAGIVDASMVYGSKGSNIPNGMEKYF